MIPDGIEENHLAHAVAEIEKSGIPPPRKSIYYHYILNGRQYPPKYVICLAAKYAFGHELKFDQFNAVAARDYLRARGHKVVDVRDKSAVEIQKENEELVFSEGAQKLRLHRAKERDTKMAKIAKETRLAKAGSLECEACGFDFSKAYGPMGEGYIEAHHKVPISKLRSQTKSTIFDLALVCANCHRMLHRQSPMMSVEELRKVIAHNDPNAV